MISLMEFYKEPSVYDLKLKNSSNPSGGKKISHKLLIVKRFSGICKGSFVL